MLTPVTPMLTEQASTRHDLLPAELDFYSAYDWCLDPHLTIREAIDHLRGEIDRLKVVPEGWQTGEVISARIANAKIGEQRGHQESRKNECPALGRVGETQNHSTVLCLEPFGVARQFQAQLRSFRGEEPFELRTGASCPGSSL